MEFYDVLICCTASIKSGQRSRVWPHHWKCPILGRAGDLALPHLAVQISDTAESWHIQASNQKKDSLQAKGGPRSLLKVSLLYSISLLLFYSSILFSSGKKPCRLNLFWTSFLPRGQKDPNSNRGAILQREKLEALSVCSVMQQKIRQEKQL